MSIDMNMATHTKHPRQHIETQRAGTGKGEILMGAPTRYAQPTQRSARDASYETRRHHLISPNSQRSYMYTCMHTWLGTDREREREIEDREIDR